MDKDVVHVNGDVSFVDQIAEDEVHHGLECGGGVRKTKKHDHGFKEAAVSFKGSLPLISVANAYVVIPPPDVQLREECRSATVHSREAIHKFPN